MAALPPTILSMDDVRFAFDYGRAPTAADAMLFLGGDGWISMPILILRISRMSPAERIYLLLDVAVQLAETMWRVDINQEPVNDPATSLANAIKLFERVSGDAMRLIIYAILMGSLNRFDTFVRSMVEPLQDAIEQAAYAWRIFVRDLCVPLLATFDGPTDRLARFSMTEMLQSTRSLTHNDSPDEEIDEMFWTLITNGDMLDEDDVNRAASIPSEYDARIQMIAFWDQAVQAEQNRRLQSALHLTNVAVRELGIPVGVANIMGMYADERITQKNNPDMELTNMRRAQEELAKKRKLQEQEEKEREISRQKTEPAAAAAVGARGRIKKKNRIVGIMKLFYDPTQKHNNVVEVTLPIETRAGMALAMRAFAQWKRDNPPFTEVPHEPLTVSRLPPAGAGFVRRCDTDECTPI